MENLVIPTPEFSLKLPISGHTIRYRPFLVREEKLMLTLKEAKDNNMVLENLKKIMQLCIIEEYNVNDLAYTDFEYLFLNMRTRSIGESVDLEVPCSSCEKKTPCSLDLNEVSEAISNTELPETSIMLTEQIGVIVKPLDLRHAGVALNLTEKDQLKGVALFIDKIYTKDEVHTFAELSPQQQNAFIDSLSMKHLTKITDRVNEFPSLSAKIDYTCTHCGHSGSHAVEGLENFFT